MIRARRAARSTVRRVALVARAHKPDALKVRAELALHLRRRRIEVVEVPSLALPGAHAWTPDPAAARTARDCDLLVTLGGDGTVLAGARIVAGTRVPLLPINLGGLGFLASFEGADRLDALEAALAGDLVEEPRSMLGAWVEPRANGRGRKLGLALNDVLLKQPTTYRALRLEVHVGDAHLGLVVADGLVAASPSGSTGYSLSAGGPVLAPGVEAMVVTPICPHTLGMRPLVLPATLSLRARVVARDGGGATVSLDGLPGVPLPSTDRLRVSLVPDAVRFLRPPGASLPVVLPHKLGWSGSPRRSRS